MGMKGLMCEILVDKQKELIESLESKLRTKNEIIINKTKRANEMFRLSYNRKLQIKEQQEEINRLKEENTELSTALKTIVWLCESSPSIESIKQNAIYALGVKK
jgi:signal transduction histidine kinase